MMYTDRKHPRLKHYDYSLPGYYYVTVHNEKAAPALSFILQNGEACNAVVTLTPRGKIAEQQLLALETRYPYARIDKYVIMPTHIHFILQLLPGQLPRPSLIQILQAYKSLTTRACNQAFRTPGLRQFQTSFYEHVLRNEKAYLECWKYIDENPAKWILSPEDL